MIPLLDGTETGVSPGHWLLGLTMLGSAILLTRSINRNTDAVERSSGEFIRQMRWGDWRQTYVDAKRMGVNPLDLYYSASDDAPTSLFRR